MISRCTFLIHMVEPKVGSVGWIRSELAFGTWYGLDREGVHKVGPSRGTQNAGPRDGYESKSR